MKFLIPLSFLFLSFQHSNSEKYSEIKFEETTYDFGNIEEGTELIHKFKFKNIGNADLVVTYCQSDKLAPYWDKEPIKPGKGGEITLKMNTNGILGFLGKGAVVRSNSIIYGTINLIIKAFIIPAKSK